ncbi:hypothetical protein C2S51_001114 [Perilla frutescens var. frutescens]|nr:hypothetical protein C2S51_001114 [Perilla frutescens var. frutescens]
MEFFLLESPPLRVEVNMVDWGQSLRDWMEKVAQVDDPNFHSLFAYLLWVNWKVRNNMIFQGIQTPHEVCFDMAVKLHNEFQETFECKHLSSRTPIIEMWQKPLDGW